MKFVLVALSLVALSQASTIALAPSIYSPIHLAAPIPAVKIAPAPLTYIAHPQVLIAHPAPVIQPGYVAATRGSLHIAPLPGDTPLASHHLNLAPAPGTI